jgi:hypothetical protein
MARDPLMSRLRTANPDPLADLCDDPLRDRILADPPAWRASVQAGAPSLRRGWVPRTAALGGVRPVIAAGGMLAAALAVALAVALTGSTPSVAHAFPALNNASALTPVTLEQALRQYGVGPGDGGLNIAEGHVVETPWGHGYVLTGPGDRFVCLVGPGLSSADWGASCAQTKQARSGGTGREPYAYDPTTHSARVVALLPEGATATAQTGRGAPRQLRLPDGVLAVTITAPTQIAVTIDGHTTTDRVSPQNATPAPGPSSGSSGSSTTAARSSTGP